MTANLKTPPPSTAALHGADEPTPETGRKGWKRARREVLRVLIVLLLLELAVRVEPIRSTLSAALAPYENLLWYADIMPAYRDQLQNGEHYDLWLAGSSYMMTGWHPEWVANGLKEAGVENVSVQNYGMTDMRQLRDMAAVFDRWMFEMDTPEYFILGVSVFNFSATGRAPVTESPMERAFIFPADLNDQLAGWLYKNSALYRYTLLARNATFVPRDETVIEPHPLGGFIPGETPFEDCNPDGWQAPDRPQDPYPDSIFAPLDTFIDVLQSRDIPVLVVDIPLQYCNMRRFFPSEAAYQHNYLGQLSAHLEAAGIPFLNMSERFYAEIPDDQQHLYFMDHHHPNLEGAKLFSAWTAEFAAEWLKNLKPGD
jgi:hypothetical protein